jgi:hypothetical protein
MKTIGTFALLILVASMAFGGMTNNAFAAEDPAFYLKIAKRAQEQIQNQISTDSSDKVQRLFQEGTQQVNALEESLSDHDVNSAKENFLSAMKIFKQISRELSTSDTVSDVASKSETSVKDTVRDPSNDLDRLQAYVNSLKAISKKHNASIDFSELDELFSKARQQINEKQFTQSQETAYKIKETVIEVSKELREKAAKQESQRAKEYAQKYLEQLDRLIENAKKQGISDEIIKKLETARENLSSATNPNEIIEQTRKIISIKDQFDLTKNDRLESRVLQVEKTLYRLYQVEGVNQDDLVDAENTLLNIKQNLNDGELETANDLLRDLAKKLAEIKNPL